MSASATVTPLPCRTDLVTWFFLAALVCSSCGPNPDSGEDAQVTTLGSLEVTAELEEIRGQFPNLPNYDYAFVFKYRVLEVYRGELKSDTLYVGHYNPLKPRDGVKDARVKEIGGNLGRFRVGELHRMALEVPIDDYYMGGIVNRYFKEKVGPIYWAVWTNRVVK